MSQSLNKKLEDLKPQVKYFNENYKVQAELLEQIIEILWKRQKPAIKGFIWAIRDKLKEEFISGQRCLSCGDRLPKDGMAVNSHCDKCWEEE